MRLSVLSLLLCAFLAACAKPAAPLSPAGATDHLYEVLGEAYDAVNSGRCAKVPEITQPAFDQLAALRQQTRLTSTRTPDLAELTSMTGIAKGQASETTVVDSGWADLYYLRAYCEVEAQQYERAIATLREGLEIIPGDVLLSAELGHAQQSLGRFTEAMASFQTALADVQRLSETTAAKSDPEWVINGQTLRWWHGRCLRGIGYSQIELGQLEEAEATYREALAVNPDDEQSHIELGYIQQLRLRMQ